MATTAKPPTSYRGAVEDSAYGAWLADVLEHVPDVMYPLSVQTYGRMRKDPSIAAVLAAYTLPIRRATWAVDPTGCRPEVAQLVADDIGLPLAGQDTPGAARVRGVSWAEHLRTALLHLVWGHYGHEMLAKVDGNGRARLVGLSDRMPSTISNIHVSDQGVLEGISQDLRGVQDSPQIPADRLVWYCHEREGAAWFGASLLRPAFSAFLIKAEMLRVSATSHRRFGMGVPVVEWDNTAAPTPAQHSQALQTASAARVGESSGLALPPGARLVLKGLEGGTPDTLGFIRYLDQQISRMALAGFLDLGTTETGARALGETFLDLFMMSIQSTADYVADVVTRQIAARVVGWNFGEDEAVPRITVADVGSRHEVTAEALNTLLHSGALSADPALESWVRRTFRLPEREAAPVPSPAPTGAGTGQPTAPVAAARARRTRGKTVAAGQTALPIAAADSGQADDAAQEQHQTAWSAALAALLVTWPDLSAPMVTALVDASVAAVESGDVAALGALQVPTDVQAGIAAAIGDAMRSLATESTGHVVAEAAAQGATITAPADPGADDVAQVATAVTGLIAGGYATAAARKALQTGTDGVADAVTETLTDMGTAETGMVAENIAAALSAAQNAGRAAVFRAYPPTSLRADERLDKTTCEPCAKVANRVWTDLEEALSAYPTSGFVGCLGTLRCRGYLVPSWT